MSISFNSVPAQMRVPFVFVEFDASNAVQGSSIQPWKVLVMGQKLSAGAQAAGALVRVSDFEDAKTKFGQGSYLAQMIKALKANNGLVETWAIAQDDSGSGVVGARALTFAGPATADGTLSLYIAGQAVSVAVASGDTATVVAAAMAAAISALDDLPVTAAALAGVLTLTSKHKGELAKKLDVRFNYFDGEAFPAGLTCSVASWTGGTGNPSVAASIAAMGEEQFNLIAFPYLDSSNLGLMKTELLDRWGAIRMNDGVMIAADDDTTSNLSTLGDAHNSQHLVVFGVEKCPTPVYEQAAAFAGVIAGSASIDPARPLQTLQVKGVLAPNQADRFTLAERNLLLFDGIATTKVDSGGNMILERVITTYKKSPSGADDIAYLDLETVLTLSFLRYDFRGMFMRKYPRHKLANDGTRFSAGQAVMTPKQAKAESIALFREWEANGLVEDVTQFKNDLIVERNSIDPNRLDIMLPPNLMNGLRVMGVKIGFLL